VIPVLSGSRVNGLNVILEDNFVKGSWALKDDRSSKIGCTDIADAAMVNSPAPATSSFWVVGSSVKRCILLLFNHPCYLALRCQFLVHPILD
jgi:hypothetical protein